MQGIVFDIKRGSTNDGPGLRTTVFLKGCPLRCLWCHNPEAMRRPPEVRFVDTLCRTCGACVEACPNRLHRIDAEQGHVFDRTGCAVCGRCVAACPSGALAMAGGAMSVDEVMRVVIRDAAYYRRSGGGMTLSGGEPLVQHQFARQLLAAAGDRRIHTCLDTTGHAPTEHLMGLADHVDLFLYDYKESDPQRHRRYTGVDNALILRNLAELDRRGKRHRPPLPDHPRA